MSPACRAFPFALLLLAWPQAHGGLWDDLRQGATEAVEKGKAAAGGAVQATKDFAGEAVDVTKDVAGKAAAKGEAFVSDTKEHFQREGTPEAQRAESDALAYQAMDRLFVDDPEAHGLFDRCFGYAVFDRLYPCGSAHFSPLGRVAADFLADKFFHNVAMHVKY
jgi:hypothetical protein